MSYDVIDPLAYLEQVIKDRTCEWCARVYPEPIKKQWIVRPAAGNGYTSKHARYWRVCAICTSAHSFRTWILPAIANMPNMVMDAILSVQSMRALAQDVPRIEMYVVKHRAPAVVTINQISAPHDWALPGQP